MKSVLRLLAKEPVMLGSVALAWFAILNPSEAVLAAFTVTVGLVVRWLSTPEQVAKAREEAAHANGQNELAAFAASDPAKSPAVKKATPRRKPR